LSIVTEQIAKGDRSARGHPRGVRLSQRLQLNLPACTPAWSVHAIRAQRGFVSVAWGWTVACMEPIGSHYAVLLHDRSLRSTLSVPPEPRLSWPRLVTNDITGRVRALAGKSGIDAGAFRLTRVPSLRADSTDELVELESLSGVRPY
jgi:hypothetical protein